jgi:hypothetical protein
LISDMDEQALCFVRGHIRDSFGRCHHRHAKVQGFTIPIGSPPSSRGIQGARCAREEAIRFLRFRPAMPD